MRALLRPEDDVRVHGLLLATDLFPEIWGLHPLRHGGTAARVGRGVGVGVRGDVVQVDVFAVGELGRGFGWGGEVSGYGRFVGWGRGVGGVGEGGAGGGVFRHVVRVLAWTGGWLVCRVLLVGVGSGGG